MWTPLRLLSYVRPVWCGHLVRLREIRETRSLIKLAHSGRIKSDGVFSFLVDASRITFCRHQFLAFRLRPRQQQPIRYGLNSCLRASRAQAIRAILLARATETSRTGFFSSNDCSHCTPGVSLPRLWRITAVAPTTSSRRR